LFTVRCSAPAPFASCRIPYTITGWTMPQAPPITFSGDTTTKPPTLPRSSYRTCQKQHRIFCGRQATSSCSRPCAPFSDTYPLKMKRSSLFGICTMHCRLYSAMPTAQKSIANIDCFSSCTNPVSFGRSAGHTQDGSSLRNCKLISKMKRKGPMPLPFYSATSANLPSCRIFAYRKPQLFASSAAAPNAQSSPSTRWQSLERITSPPSSWSRRNRNASG